jgi:hypothetical protein
MGEGRGLRCKADATDMNHAGVLAGFIRELFVEPRIDAEAVAFEFDRAEYRTYVAGDGVFHLCSTLAVADSYPQERVRELLQDELGVRSGIAVSLDEARSIVEAASIIFFDVSEEEGRRSDMQAAFFEGIRELAVARRSITAALMEDIGKPIPPLYLDAAPKCFEEFRSGLTAKTFNSVLYVPHGDAITALLMSLDAARVRRRCACGDANCMTYDFFCSDQASRSIRFDVDGEAVLDVSDDMQITSAERLLPDWMVKRSDPDDLPV